MILVKRLNALAGLCSLQQSQACAQSPGQDETHFCSGTERIPPRPRSCPMCSLRSLQRRRLPPDVPLGVRGGKAALPWSAQPLAPQGVLCRSRGGSGPQGCHWHLGALLLSCPWFRWERAIPLFGASGAAASCQACCQWRIWGSIALLFHLRLRAAASLGVWPGGLCVCWR